MKNEKTWFLNGIPIPPNPNLILPVVLASISDIQYWSAEAIKILFTETLEIGIKMAKEEKKQKKGVGCVKLTRFINSVPNKIRFLPKKRMQLVKLCYSEILSSEGLSTLPGYGIGGKLGEKYIGNPEFQSLIPKTV